MAKVSFNTDKDFKQNYKFMIGSILPRPIALVSTRNEDGSFNLAPFSFFNGICSSPFLVSFCPVRKPLTGDKKHTLSNIEREQECVISIVTEDIAEATNNCATELDLNESEFDFSGLTPTDSEMVKAACVKESPINMECKLFKVLEFGDGNPGNGALVICEVVKIHIDESLLEEGRINTDLLKPIGRGAGNDWVKCHDRIQYERKQKAQIQ